MPSHWIAHGRCARLGSVIRLLVIGIGGFLGSVSRYLLSGAFQSLFRSATFPFGTFLVNLTGCLVIGVLAQLAESRSFLSGTTRAFLIVGVLGGYTTFSAFAHESVNLLRAREFLLAGANVTAQVLLGLACVWAGRIVAQLIWR